MANIMKYCLFGVEPCEEWKLFGNSRLDFTVKIRTLKVVIRLLLFKTKIQRHFIYLLEKKEFVLKTERKIKCL